MIVQTATASVAGEVAVVGVTWTPKDAPLHIWVRTISEGTTSPWSELGSSSSSDGTLSRGSTDDVVIVGAERVEALIVHRGSVEVSLKVHSSNPTPRDRIYGQSADPLGIRSRADWSANESITQEAPYAQVTGVMIHHTAGSNTYTAAQVPAILRSIQQYHVESRGWRDIGYNVLVDKYGTAWEGRAGGLSRAVEGGHGYGVTNQRTFGLSFMGDYSTARPTEAMLDKAERIIAWKFQLHGVDPYGKTWGSSGELNAISGHRDEQATSCPGDYVYSQMDRIRSKVKGYLSTYASNRNPVSDLTGDGKADLLWVGSDNVQLLQPFAEKPAQTALDVAGLWEAVIPGDWNGDGKVDVLGRTSDGTLMMYPGLGGGQFSTSGTSLGTAWRGDLQLVGAPNFLGDGLPAFLGYNRTQGTITAYIGNGRGGLTERSIPLATNAFTYQHLAVMGPWNGDSTPDVLATTTDGRVMLLPGNGGGQFSEPIAVTPSEPLGTFFISAGQAIGTAAPDLFDISEAGLRIVPGAPDTALGTPQLLDASVTKPVTPPVSQKTGDVAVKAYTAGTKPVNEVTNTWGTVSGINGPATVYTEVWLGNRWSRSQVRTTNDAGFFVIPLTYGANTPGTYTYRVSAVVDGMTYSSDEFTLQRTGSSIAVKAYSANTKRINQVTNTWGTVSGVSAPVTVYTEVWLGNRWSRSQTRTTDKTGYFVIPLTYGFSTPGIYRWRVAAVVDGKAYYSNEFTLTRTR